MPAARKRRTPAANPGSRPGQGLHPHAAAHLVTSPGSFPSNLRARRQHQEQQREDRAGSAVPLLSVTPQRQPARQVTTSPYPLGPSPEGRSPDSPHGASWGGLILPV